MVIITLIFTLVAALVPAMIWLVFFLKEDVHPEPRRLIIYTFNVGILVSLLVLAAQVIFQNTIGTLFESTIVAIIGLALIEEIFKFLAAYWAVHNDPAFDEPIDAMIYTIAAALGFATVENFFIFANLANATDILVIPNILRAVSLRFVGATLLHVLAAALIGYYWALDHRRGPFTKMVVVGLLLATFIHAVFNYLILKFQAVNLLYPSLFLIIATFFILNDFEKLKTIKE
ncbi:PrsW family intramembrane metalloprotease [Candidatus Jorgensenbacteria bacterium]|nr:PrsW family intramembrane metalloprotease [Candidatus Jorgensenbacteria bacterium]